MTLNAILHFAAAIFCIGLACFGLVREPRSFVHRVFALGMVLLALESLFTGLSVLAILPGDVIFWQRWRFGAAALLPGIWLVFTVSFTSSDYKATLTKWKWFVLLNLLLPLAFASIFTSSFFQQVPTYEPSQGWLLPLGWSGQAFHICFILSVVLIIVLLERTLRVSMGLKRWKLKFLVLGVGAVFALRIYTLSQVLLFDTVSLELEAMSAAALLVADMLILVSIFRTPVLSADIYLSHAVIYNSFTVIAVGIYFLVVGLLAKVVRPINALVSFPVHSFLVFLALLGLLIVLLSDQLRQNLRHFISRHFSRSHYDYRKAWSTFANRTASLVEVPVLCDVVCKMVAEILSAPAVSIWLIDENRKSLTLGGSTVLSEIEVKRMTALQEGTEDFIKAIATKQESIDLHTTKLTSAKDFKKSHSTFLEETRIRYCFPLYVTEYDLLGAMTLDYQIGIDSLSIEERDLIKSIGDQTAASLFNLKLSEHLRETKEMEAFQTVAAFFVHDLKNLASNLSMTLQNLPAHFDNPEFRQDALRTLSKSVTKINKMCTRISSLRERVEIQSTETDLNELVRATLAELRGSFNGSVVEELQPVPKVYLDSAQIRKVLTNLVMNANESLSNGGQIRVATNSRDGWVELIVSDDGCGMSRRTMAECLFKPFKSTKKQGMGIGLFHSKMIVEAHKGRIEVESEEGVGSTFRVLLPIEQT